jgi:colanic acid biosynthesis glycosyl transferase WcaI
LRLQLWTIYYEPEPTGIAPVATLLARLLFERGWEVNVVAAHPHYPEPRWGTRWLPYREVLEGITVVRVPLWIGRKTAAERMRQEVSFASALVASSPLFGRPFLKRPDAMLVISPSFPALLPAIVNARLRRLPLALWLHDLLPDGATASGLVTKGGLVLKASRWLERTAYREADRIVVLSAPFAQNLHGKGVPAEKIELIYAPATRGVPADTRVVEHGVERRVLCMGNIGLTQGLAPLVRDFEASDRMSDLNVKLIITGNGVAADDVRAEIRSDRVEMPGLVDDERLERELRSATLALVSQAYEGTEFNLPSKLMNYMSYGLPVIAAVNPSSETARLVREAGAGWVTGSSVPGALPTAIAQALSDPVELAARGRAAREYAVANFSPQAFGNAFDHELRALTNRRPTTGGP